MKLITALAFSLSLAVLPACKKSNPPSENKAAPSAESKLAQSLIGKWNDKEDGSLAYEFMAGGKCKAMGEMDCNYEIKSETGQVLLLRYKAVDTWEDIEVTFEPPDSASWKNLAEEKTDPDTAVTKLVRAK